jgi:hypothetical protein
MTFFMIGPQRIFEEQSRMAQKQRTRKVWAISRESASFKGVKHPSWNWAHDGMVQGVAGETWRGAILTKFIKGLLTTELRLMAELHKHEDGNRPREEEGRIL